MELKNEPEVYLQGILKSACETGELEALKNLIKNGTNVDEKHFLEGAIIANSLEVIGELLKAGADVNIKNQIGNTGLILASHTGPI